MPYKDPLKKKENSRRWYAKNRDRVLDYRRQYYLRDRSRYIETRKRYCEKHREKIAKRVRIYGLRTKYNITKEQFDILLSKQLGKCPICGIELEIGGPVRRRRAVIDHDHSCCPTTKTCGKCIRGILCNRCNAVIGHMNDDVNLLQKAVVYLVSNRKGSDVNIG